MARAEAEGTALEAGRREAVALPVLAIVAGVVSFSSPCCLPLVPGYLSYVSGLPVSEIDDAHARRATLRASLLFVAGFTAVFTVLASLPRSSGPCSCATRTASCRPSAW